MTIALYTDPVEHVGLCGGPRDPNVIILSCHRYLRLELAETLAGPEPAAELRLAVESWNDPPTQTWLVIAETAGAGAAQSDLVIREMYNLPTDGSDFCVAPEHNVDALIPSLPLRHQSLFSCAVNDHGLPRDRVYRGPEVDEFFETANHSQK